MAAKADPGSSHDQHLFLNHCWAARTTSVTYRLIDPTVANGDPSELVPSPAARETTAPKSDSMAPSNSARSATSARESNGPSGRLTYDASSRMTFLSTILASLIDSIERSTN